VCDTNTKMYRNYILTGEYDLNNSIILNGMDEENFKCKDNKWNELLPRDKILERYNKIIQDRNLSQSKINRIGRSNKITEI